MVDYNKALLDKWYTQAEIDQMRAAVNSWQSAKDAVANMNAQKSSSNQATNTQTNTWMNSMSQTKAQDNSRNSQYGTWDVATIQQNQTQNNVTPTTTPWTTWSEIKTNNFQESWDKLSASQQASLMKRKEFSDYINSRWYTVKKEEPTTTTTPTTKKTTTQTTPKQQQWDYQDNSQARMDQIANNLRGYEDSMPRLFDNWAEYYNFFIKDKWRSQDQIDFLEKYFDDYKKFSPYNNWSSSALWDWLANGDVPKEYLDYLRSRDPAKYQEVLSYKQDTEDRIKHEAYLDSLSSEAWFESEESETKKYPWAVEYAKEMGYLVDENWDWIDDYRYIPPTPEELTKQDRVNQIDSRVMEIKNMQKNMLDDLVEQYPWVPKATLMWIVQDRTKDIQREYDDLMVERAWLVWNIEYMQNERNAQMDARQATIDNLQKAYWMYYQYSPWGIAERTEAQYAATNITLDQADSGNETQKQMALQNVLDWYYEKYWDIIERSEQQVINDVIAYAKKNWIWLAQALDENFTQYLREKPWFKALSTWGTVWWTSKYATIKDWNWNIIMYDTTSGNWENLWWWTWTSTTTTTSWWKVTNEYWKSYTPVSTTKLEEWLWDFLLDYEADWVSTKWWQCWAFVNNWLKAAGVISENIYDNSLTSKLKSKNQEADATAQAGWVAIRNPEKLTTANWKKHWHVWFVLSDNWDWTVTVMDSNWVDMNKDGVYDETTYIHDVPKSSLYWYFDPTKEYGNVSQGGVDDIMTEYWVPLLFHNAIWGDIPTKEKDNVNEKADIQARIKALYDAWLDANTASVVYKWWNVKAGTEPELSNQLLTVMLSTTEMPEPNQFRRVANFINNWQTDVAIKIVEEIINEQAKDDAWYVSELQTRNVLNKSMSLKNYITWLNKNPIGNFTGTVEKWLWKFNKKESAQIKQYLSDIETYLRDTMNIDDDRIKLIVPQLDDSIQNFRAKLNWLESSQLALLNNRRRMYFLPSLQKSDVWHPETRYDVYVQNSWTQWFGQAK